MRITLDAITKRFDEITAVDAVSLTVEQGECFFLLGPSGCGKTTVLRIISGFIAPDSGRVTFDDRDVTRLPPHMRNTGMVFQQYALWPHMTVYRNVEFGLKAPGRHFRSDEIANKVRRALELVRMDDFADRKPNQLSGGQQQRVALARALVVEPGCLLLDEPLSNLDARLRIEMRIEIRRIVKNMGITTVYVTHDQAEALSMADRCSILKNGRVEQIGAPREIYEKPKSRFVADFVGGSNLISGIISRISANDARVATTSGEWISCAHTSRLRPGDRVAISVRPENVRVIAADDSKPNLFRGTIRETMYYGNVIEHLIEFSSGDTIRAIVPGSEALHCQAGADILCWTEPEDVLILPED